MATGLSTSRKRRCQIPGGSVSVKVPSLLKDKVMVFLELYEDMATGHYASLSGCEAERRQLVDDFKRMMEFEKERLDHRREIEDQRQQSLF